MSKAISEGLSNKLDNAYTSGYRSINISNSNGG